MDFLVIFGFHFLIMGALVMLVSGIVLFLFQKIHFGFIVLVSMLGGYLYAAIFEVPGLVPFAIVFNSIFSLLAVFLVQITLYAGRKADRMDDNHEYI
ncbi:hypothetical protein [Pseudalkalibacillus caeni]|uniref:Uncharacterized protein n=1 Tax=Exobacillus caeni TaxID=2574798 RepID=A0A5R9F0A4_9BACL|nr:hypothetical protein [Pseudalkalibacillus caeni]TLS37042.1 hypothetical protein FCL54_10960 [Pseudalkalibacillus caeni]